MKKSIWTMIPISQSYLCQSMCKPTIASTTTYATQKLIQMLQGDISILRNQWSLDRILIILVIHWKDLILYMTYWQFKIFVYKTMMKEKNKETRYLPNVIIQKDFDLIIKLCHWKKIKKQYSLKLKFFSKSPFFGLATQNTSSLVEFNQHLLENVIKKALEKTPLLNNIIIMVGFSSH